MLNLKLLAVPKRFPLAFKPFRGNRCSTPCLHGEGVDQVQCSPLERVRLGRHGKGRGTLLGGGAAGVTHAGGQLREEGWEAVDRGAILVMPACDLRFGCG